MYEVRIKTKEGEGMSKVSSEIEEIRWKITGKDLGKT
jgi:hypothetical protein